MSDIDARHVAWWLREIGDTRSAEVVTALQAERDEAQMEYADALIARDAAIRRAEAAEADADALAAAIDSGAHWGCTCPWDEEGNPSGYGGEHYPTCKRGQPLTGAAALACHAKAVAERGQP